MGLIIMKNNRYDANRMEQHRGSMKIMKAKSMTAMILFLALSFALSGIVSAQITQITENTYEDIYPQTAGGYVVWQARIDGDMEIFLYNANDKTGPLYRTPFQITTNTYGDISPQTDGRYVTWAAGSARYGEIFIYNIATFETTQLTDNNVLDDNLTVFNGHVVWVSSPVGEFSLGPGDIFLYDIANETITNVSRKLDPNNIYDDKVFRFDGQQIFWFQEDFQQGSEAKYLYDLASGSIYRYYTPVDDVPYLYDLATFATYPKPEGLTLQDDPRVDGDFRVSTTMMDGNREIVLWDKKHKHNGRITANDIEDSQPSIGGYILAWKGDKGNDAEIYIYEIPPLTLVSPDDGSEFHIKEFLEETPVFVWESSNKYIQFKIQFSTVASFEGEYTLTFPESDDAWLKEPSITLEEKQAAQLIELIEDEDEGLNKLLYWRVLAQDGYGSDEVSDALSLGDEYSILTCTDGSLLFITEMDYDRDDEELDIEGRASAGTTISIIDSDSGEILADNIMIREGRWEAEIEDVGDDLETISIISSNGCVVDQDVETDDE
jgi:hypothetical protein